MQVTFYYKVDYLVAISFNDDGLNIGGQTFLFYENSYGLSFFTLVVSCKDI